MAIKVRIRRRSPTRSGEPWRSRIVDHADVDPRTLAPNDKNWRKHPDRQRSALRGSLDEVGWVSSIMVNRRTGRMIDGHARVEEALRKGETAVPVDYVDLSEEEEKLVLATLDPIGALAEADNDKLEELLGDITSDGEHTGLLASVFDDADDDSDLSVEEIDTSTVQDEFWVSVRGPLPAQPDALDRLKEALEGLPGVTVDVGGVEGL